MSISKHKCYHETYLVANFQVTFLVETRLAHMTNYVSKCTLVTTMKLSNLFNTQSQGLFPIYIGYTAVFMCLVMVEMWSKWWFICLRRWFISEFLLFTGFPNESYVAHTQLWFRVVVKTSDVHLVSTKCNKWVLHEEAVCTTKAWW